MTLAIDLSPPNDADTFTHTLWVRVRKTTAGTYPDDLKIEIRRNEFSAVTFLHLHQEDISDGTPGGAGWYAIALTPTQVENAISENDTHIVLTMQNGIIG